MSKFYKEWEGFESGKWTKGINVRSFIQRNYKPYTGGDEFLVDPTEATTKLWDEVMRLTKLERENGGVLDADSDTISSITSHKAGYLDKDLEKVVGVQTDKPFKRALMPYGGIRMAVKANEEYGFTVSDRAKEIFGKYRKTHNEGVYNAYTPEMREAKRSGIITGLPDTYARGRVIGDYRRVALYGIDYLIEEKTASKEIIGKTMTPDVIRLREEVSDQIKALEDMKKLGAFYGFDISKPAKNAKEAFQWTYFGYLAAIKDQNGAAMSVGRVETFLDCYIERDLKNGTLTEQEAQELVDHFVMKLRIVKFMRPGAYNELFSGDPVWATLVLGGQGIDGRTLVSKTTFRFIHTLSNMGPAPEPNLTILWSKHLPRSFKKFCAKYSILFSSMQYESDDLMRETQGDDYAIACCVSPMKVGKQMQFFGARCNLPKALLLSINSGRDEIKGSRLGPKLPAMTGEYLNYDEVKENLETVLVWLAELYTNTLNVIHYMHDKYYYEAAEMALHDLHVHRFFATGIAGLSVLADSLSAIKHAKVKPIKNEAGITVDFKVEGDFPKYGNDNDDVDEIAAWVVKFFMNEIRKQTHYRDSEPTMSVLTITSNVVYGKKTGATPDGRAIHEPFAPGANPMHGRDSSGAVASLASVSKIPFEHSSDGISNTFSIIPNALGKEDDLEIVNIAYDDIVTKK